MQADGPADRAEMRAGNKQSAGAWCRQGGGRVQGRSGRVQGRDRQRDREEPDRGTGRGTGRPGPGVRCGSPELSALSARGSAPRARPGRGRTRTSESGSASLSLRSAPPGRRGPGAGEEQAVPRSPPHGGTERAPGTGTGRPDRGRRELRPCPFPAARGQTSSWSPHSPSSCPRGSLRGSGRSRATGRRGSPEGLEARGRGKWLGAPLAKSLPPPRPSRRSPVPLPKDPPNE